MLIHRSTHGITPTRVVLLGAGGFLAQELLVRLESESVPVRALGSSQIDLTHANAVDQLTAVLQPDDTVVMTSCITPEKGRDIATLMKNVRMAETVSGAISRQPPAHFVYMSSDAVYDAQYSSLLNEDSTCEPKSLYALAHIARERILEDACASRDVPFTVVRPCAIYGARDTHNSYGPNRFIRSAIESGKITIFGNGEERRHHAYVDDIARIVKLCLFHRSVGTVNAVTGSAVSFRTVAETIILAASSPIAVESLPRSNPVVHRQYDITQLIRAFPDFQATSLSQGIGNTLADMIGQSI